MMPCRERGGGRRIWLSAVVAGAKPDLTASKGGLARKVTRAKETSDCLVPIVIARRW